MQQTVHCNIAATSLQLSKEVQKTKNRTKIEIEATNKFIIKYINQSSRPNLKGHSGAELHIYFLVHLESIYYQIFFYSKIVPNCAVAK